MRISGAGPGSASSTSQPPAMEVARQRRRVLHRRRQPDPAQPRRQRLQPGQQQHQLVAAFRFRQRVQLVDHHPLQARRTSAARLRRRAAARGSRAWSAGYAAGRRAGPSCGSGWCRPSGRRPGSARPSSAIGPVRLRRMSAASAFSGEMYKVCKPGAGISASSTSVGRNPASVLPPPVGAISSVAGSCPARQHLELVRMRRPALGANQSARGGGQGGHVRRVGSGRRKKETIRDGTRRGRRFTATTFETPNQLTEQRDEKPAQLGHRRSPSARSRSWA